MCVSMFSGVGQNLHAEPGVNFTKVLEGDVENPYFFENNFDEGKPLPSGPACSFKYKRFLVLKDGPKRVALSHQS